MARGRVKPLPVGPARPAPATRHLDAAPGPRNASTLSISSSTSTESPPRDPGPLGILADSSSTSVRRRNRGSEGPSQPACGITERTRRSSTSIRQEAFLPTSDPTRLVSMGAAADGWNSLRRSTCRCYWAGTEAVRTGAGAESWRRALLAAATWIEGRLRPCRGARVAYRRVHDPVRPPTAALPRRAPQCPTVTPHPRRPA